MSAFEKGVIVFVLLFIVGGLIAGQYVTKMINQESNGSDEQE